MDIGIAGRDGGQIGAGVAGQLNMQLFGDRRRQQ